MLQFYKENIFLSNILSFNDNHGIDSNQLCIIHRIFYYIYTTYTRQWCIICHNFLILSTVKIMKMWDNDSLQYDGYDKNMNVYCVLWFFINKCI